MVEGKLRCPELVDAAAEGALEVAPLAIQMKQVAERPEREKTWAGKPGRAQKVAGSHLELAVLQLMDLAHNALAQDGGCDSVTCLEAGPSESSVLLKLKGDGVRHLVWFSLAATS